jgi:hypothetical protein
MKGFKPTGFGPKSGFTYPSKMGFTGSTGSVTSVAGYSRRKGYANGGFVKEGYQPKTEQTGDTGHATVYRNRPSTNLDQESGGKTPLRPGFAKGGKNWIQGAIKKPGALHKALGVPQGQKIPAKKLAKAAHADSGKMRQRAALAKTLGTMRKADGGTVGNKAMIITKTDGKLSQKEKETKRDQDMSTARNYRRAIENNLAVYRGESDPNLRKLFQKANDIGFGVPNHTPNFDKTRDYKPKKQNYADGGKVAGAKALVETAVKETSPPKALGPGDKGWVSPRTLPHPSGEKYKVYSKDGKLVGQAKTHQRAGRIMDKKDNEYGAYHHYIMTPDGKRYTYGDGGRVGTIANLVKNVMGKAKTAATKTSPPPSPKASALKAPYAYVDRRTGERRDYNSRDLRDAAVERRRKLEGVAFFDPIDSASDAAKRRGGAVKMPRC